MADNWAVQQMKKRVGQLDFAAPPPDLTLALILWLEREFPPRCYDPKTENLEQHLLYAGKAELVEGLRNYFEQDKALDSADGSD